jgi:hypothetical protein
MSILRCDKHDLRYDTDFREVCPVCEAESNPVEILRAIVGTLLKCGIDVTAKEIK